MSPLVDVGQVEGAFVMGQGLFTTEKPMYDPTTGRRLTDSTWVSNDGSFGCKSVVIRYKQIGADFLVMACWILWW